MPPDGLSGFFTSLHSLHERGLALVLRALLSLLEVCPFLPEPLVPSPGLVLLAGLSLPREGGCSPREPGSACPLARRDEAGVTATERGADVFCRCSQVPSQGCRAGTSTARRRLCRSGSHGSLKGGGHGRFGTLCVASASCASDTGRATLI